MRRSPVPGACRLLHVQVDAAACLERDKTPLARACTIAPCVAVFLAIWFALPHLLTFWTEDYEPSAYYIRFALISTFWPAYIITQARC